MSIIISIVFCIAPFISIPLIFIGIIYDKKRNWLYAFLLALVFAIIAYNFKPTVEQDLFRYYVEMQANFSKINFFEYLNKYFFNTKILFKLFQYIICHIGNYRLLQFFITLIGYYISFYMILDFSKLKKCKPIITIFTFLVFVFMFYHINFISGLAQYLAISIGFLAFYLEYIKKKSKPIYKILYILPMFIHVTMIIILLFRIMLNFDYKKTKLFYIIFLLIYAIFPNLVYILIKSIPFLFTIANKIYIYMIEPTFNSFSTYYIFTVIVVIFFAILFYRYKKGKKKQLPIQFLNLMEFILLFNIFSIPYSVIFTRIFNLTILCMCILIPIYLSKNPKKSKYIIISILIVFSTLSGSVTFNIISTNNFNNIFNKLHKSIFYYLK